MDINRIIDEYHSTESIERTANNLGCSFSQIKKVLITAGEYESGRSREIIALAAQGKNSMEIADLLGIGLTAVNANMPYKRGFPPDKPSDNAVKIRKCRQRKKAPM